MAKKYYNDKAAMMRAGMMISEDRGAPCNLPRSVIQREYPQTMSYMDKSIADLYSGVEEQMRKDGSDFKKILDPAKY